jgi:nicotinate-nucleotide pyrophosphorylase (carboxylating)
MTTATFNQVLDEIITRAIYEDITDPDGLIPTGDHSSLACFGTAHESSARLVVKANGILAGVELAQRICLAIDPALRLEVLMDDGAKMQIGDTALYVHGRETAILQAERLILNFMQRMSGIATITSKFVDLVAGTHVKILDTRKTNPTLRLTDKWAVRIGGGSNHRYGLYDMIMLKDNHVDYSGGIVPAIQAVTRYQQERGLSLRVEIETRSLSEIQQVLDTGGVHRIMFDNFTPALVAQAVALVAGSYETEVSGGITLDTVRAYAEAGPDYISVGALTHSAPSLDLSLKAVKK